MKSIEYASYFAIRNTVFSGSRKEEESANTVFFPEKYMPTPIYFSFDFGIL